MTAQSASKASHWRQKGQMAQRSSDDVDPYQQTENLLVRYSEQKLELFDSLTSGFLAPRHTQARCRHGAGWD